MVPPNWGFYMGDETKRRRYCKMCNVWKPDRTHHCSICNRCILNMDHHCPWINNCVGFYNRKFFMLFVIYVWTCLFIIAVSSLLFLVFTFTKIFRLSSSRTFYYFKKNINIDSFRYDFYLAFEFFLFINNTRSQPHLYCWIKCEGTWNAWVPKIRERCIVASSTTSLGDTL